MEAAVAKISTKHQVVIPKVVREALNLRAHDRVLFLVDGDRVILQPQPPSFAEALRGLHQELWPDPDA